MLEDSMHSVLDFQTRKGEMEERWVKKSWREFIEIKFLRTNSDKRSATSTTYLIAHDTQIITTSLARCAYVVNGHLTLSSKSDSRDDYDGRVKYRKTFRSFEEFLLSQIFQLFIIQEAIKSNFKERRFIA